MMLGEHGHPITNGMQRIKITGYQKNGKSKRLFQLFSEPVKFGCADRVQPGGWFIESGFTTKIHLRINAMGLPIAFALTGGEVSDYKGYLPIMNADGPAPKVLLADKGYDADFIREDMEKRGGTAMIPTKRNRLIQLPVDPAIYALRNMVERCFNNLKNARRLATRYDKTADSYLGFIHIVSIRLWMREFVNAS